ncbi:MAG: hypothetical protein EXR81_03645 [Gammaproteobacteria bacterium]|nr:hypothetical protein [Gammaproteobacteria bacterium]
MNGSASRATYSVAKAGKPVAALVDMELFEKIRRMKEQFELLSAELGKAYAKVDEEIGMKEINNSVKTVRAERRASPANISSIIVFH